MSSLLPEIPDRHAYVALHPRVEDWLPAAAAVAERHGLPRPGVADWLAGSGLVFAVGERAVLKITCPLFRQQHEAGVRVLRRLAEAPAVGAPDVLVAGEIEGWPYLVLSRVPGVQLRKAWPRVPGAQREAIVEDLGARLGMLHGLSTQDLDGLYLAWEPFLRQQVTGAEERHRGLGVPEVLLPSVLAAITAAGPLPRPGVREVLLHADLTGENVHLVREGGRWRVAGILDFGDAMLGDPEYDLAAPAVFISAGEPHLLRALLRGAGREDALDDAALPRRLAGWILLHRFGTVTPWVGKVPDPPKASLADALAPFCRTDG